ncbi:tRNA (guanosine(37)-N1)-methyltransferase TrmD [Paenibacillus filicis]|uniref:tRNA (guanine-N(1)-)-methyltransferase n=1 Tax=Paenibacillus gyeongsangnamensis TaxID=3388067 RepID=A0ABT4Q6F0_9BACL|nr:tRNA (guanosine(37)-N1)-methyltransferase TrmD [Paenibacillus filicis]MCZ8512449.1 tRNA (guanosine(37)-N1)-methyltransferase TrmD [Paenibacillus filicis]
MRIDVLTLFPGMFDGVFGASILGKAREKGLVELNTVNFRDFANNKHSTVDDYPYGGGGGMVLKAEPIFAAVEDLLERRRLACSEKQGEPGREPEASQDEGTGYAAGQPIGAESHARALPKAPRVILMCPQGEPFSQKKAEELSAEEHLVFICGHYEGYDERIREYLVTDELSIGDYVLTGGELPAMVVIDSVVRLLPGVLGNETSAVTDSFSTGLLEYPHYTRPVKFRDWEVPDILLSGHHSNIADWRRKQSILRTWRKRPELLESAGLTPKEKMWLESLRQEEANQDKQ